MRIGIDTNGGDFAPQEVIKGVELFLKDCREPVTLVLIGKKDELKTLLPKPDPEQIHIVQAPDTIGMHEHPTRALREKTKSSISIGFKLLASGETDAFISAGNTGAMLVGALYSLKPVEGILRPSISALLPKENGSTGLLLDVGLNSDCKPEQLNQFAIMGSVYAKSILGIDSPRVALLNIGEEEGKGNLLAQATYELLKNNNHITFVGNVEGREILRDKADIIVCDGFTGNIILKFAESLFEIAGEKQIKHEYFDRFNFENYGGTPVLGLSKPVIIGHGISKYRSFKNMLALAQKMIDKDVMQAMKNEVEA
jgi:glycerol-3-phosphate acyltransferase PlsX